jgi:hypothetical protein
VSLSATLRSPGHFFLICRPHCLRRTSIGLTGIARITQPLRWVVSRRFAYTNASDCRPTMNRSHTDWPFICVTEVEPSNSLSSDGALMECAAASGLGDQ